MDLFRFGNPTAPTLMQQGNLIEGAESKTWIERYREAGEFSISARVDTYLHDTLPIGSFISHADTDEIMIVENHEITDQGGDSAPMVVITGRSLETILEQRAVGSNKEFPTTGALASVTLVVNNTWHQAVALIKQYIYPSLVFDPRDALPYIGVVSTLDGSGPEFGQAETRVLERNTVYKNLLDILAVDNLGIKVIRPNRFQPYSGGDNTMFVIHKGIDRTNSVIFSKMSGDVLSADYLWSSKSNKNTAYVYGKWVDTAVYSLEPPDGVSPLYRRWMVIKSDIDSDFAEEPIGDVRATIEYAMHVQARSIMASQKNIALSKVELNPESTSLRYRYDYDLGDLVTVHGDYNTTLINRVTEHAEIEDASGIRSFPTLESIEE